MASAQFGDCILYDNSTDSTHATVQEYIDKFGVDTLRSHVQFDAHKNETEMAEMTICTDEMLANWTSARNVTIVLTKVENVKWLYENISNPVIREQLAFAMGYDTVNGICGNPPTTTIALGCKVYTATTFFRDSVYNYVYPYANTPNYTIPIQNGTFFQMMQTNWSTDNITMRQALDNLMDTGPSLLKMFSWTGGTLNALNDMLDGGVLYHSKNFTSNLFTHGNHDTFHEAKDALVNHLRKPYTFFTDFKKHPGVQRAWNNWVSKTSGNMEEFSENVEAMFHHYKHTKLSYVGGENVTLSRAMHEYMMQFQHIDYKKSRDFFITKFKHASKQKMEFGMNWENLADSNNTFVLYSTTSATNGIGAFTSWLFHLDNQYNASGCLGKGFPWVPKSTLICKPPIVVGPGNLTLWPDGFDPLHPECESYILPWVWWTSLLHLVGTLAWGAWMQIHNGVAYYFSWTLYDIQTLKIPPNAYPCLFATGLWALSLTAWAIFFVVFAFGLTCQIGTDVQKEIYQDGSDDDESLKKTPDITKLIPTPSMVVETLSKPIETLASGDLAQTLTSLAESQKQSIEDASERVKGAISDIKATNPLKNIGDIKKRLSVIPNKIKEIKLPTIKLPKLK